jgi:hypothetical protein
MSGFLVFSYVGAVLYVFASREFCSRHSAGRFCPRVVYSPLASGGHIAADDLIWGTSMSCHDRCQGQVAVAVLYEPWQV